MKRASIVMCSLSAVLPGAVVLAQAPAGDVDDRIAAARAAAGQDFRSTFINLCLPGDVRGGGRVPRLPLPRVEAPPREPQYEALLRVDGTRPDAALAVVGRRRTAPTGTRRPSRSSTTFTGSARASIHPGRCRRATASSSSTRTSPGLVP